MAIDYVPFEKPIVDIENKIDELKRMASNQVMNLDPQIEELLKVRSELEAQIFSNLSSYQRVQMARHPKRPTSLDIINALSLDFIQLYGDRKFKDDHSIVGGIGSIDSSLSCVFIGHQKGRDTKDNIYRNFGMPRPEGYRKALRLMKLAEKFDLPVITFVDTPGAYPGIDAEERGQSEAIAQNIMEMSNLRVPVISIITGEGGSGGALAIAVANKVHMLSYSVYSVISPEGCASILLKDASRAAEASEALKITADQNLKLGVIDSVIEEPVGGAHRDLGFVVSKIKETILQDLAELKQLGPDELQEQRSSKFLAMGSFKETNISYTAGFDNF